jgi:hypothetical protein
VRGEERNTEKLMNIPQTSLQIKIVTFMFNKIPLAFWCLGMKFHKLAADSLDRLSLSNKMLRLLDKKRPSHGLC